MRDIETRLARRGTSAAADREFTECAPADIENLLAAIAAREAAAFNDAAERDALRARVTELETEVATMRTRHEAYLATIFSQQ
jgi:hypothetical protein